MSIMRSALSAALAGVSVAVLAGCGGGDTLGASDPDASLAEIDPIELRMSDFVPDAATGGQARNDWMKRVTRLTDGKVTFKFYGDGTLHPPAEGLSALRSTLTDATIVPNGYFPNELPISNWTDRVFASATTGLEYPEVNLVGAAGMLAVYEEGGPTTEEMADQDVVPLVPVLSLPPVLHCSKPFSTLDDLAGRTVRVSSEESQQDVEALGMRATFMASTDQYEALQRGVIDCGLNAYTNLESYGLLDVAPHATFVSSFYGYGTSYSISKEVWDMLPTAVQEAMKQAGLESMVYFLKQESAGYKAFVETVRDAGHEMIDPAPFDEKLRAAHVSQAEPAAPSGVSDPDAVNDQVRSTFDDLLKIAEKNVAIPAGEAQSPDYLTAYLAGPQSVDWDGFLKDVSAYMASR